MRLGPKRYAGSGGQKTHLNGPWAVPAMGSQRRRERPCAAPTVIQQQCGGQGTSWHVVGNQNVTRARSPVQVPSGPELAKPFQTPNEAGRLSGAGCIPLPAYLTQRRRTEASPNLAPEIWHAAGRTEQLGLQLLPQVP